MTRYFLPFLLALAIHGMISLVPLEQRQLQHPKAGGENSIVVGIEDLPVAKEQQPRTTKQTHPSQQTTTSSVDTVQTNESLSPSHVAPRKKIEIKSERHKLVKKSPKAMSISTMSTSAPTIQTDSLSTDQNHYNKSVVVSNVSVNRDSPKQHPTSIKAKPLYQKNPKPPYPPLAQRRNWQGTVLLLVTVDFQGLCEKVKVLKGSGYSILDKAAQKTVKQWEFTPGQINGRSTTMQVQVPVHFILE